MLHNHYWNLLSVLDPSNCQATLQQELGLLVMPRAGEVHLVSKVENKAFQCWVGAGASCKHISSKLSVVQCAWLCGSVRETGSRRLDPERVHLGPRT